MSVYAITAGEGSALGEQLRIALASAPAVQRVEVLESLDAVEAGVVVHCAERNVFDQNLELARRHNVEPVARLIEILRARPAMRLVFLSSTLVAGTKRGLFTEFDSDCGQRFYNAYDRSKFEAESLLRASDVWPRVTIVRRALVLDEREAPLGPLLLTLKKRRPLLLAGDPRAEMDVMSAEAVAKAIAVAATSPQAMGKTLHVVAGPAHRRPLRALVNELERGPVWFVPPALAPLARLITLLTAGLCRNFPGPATDLRPYFRHRSTFDDFQARQLV
jgi:nucleoside-diphosphate-sugar epimerase